MARRTAIAGTAGVIAMAGIVVWMVGGNSQLMSAETASPVKTFVSECMEAQLLWREGSAGWYQAATSEERVSLRKVCDAAFNRREPTKAMQAVREGKAIVRS